MTAASEALAAVQEAQRQRKRGLYSFRVNYGPDIGQGFDSATNGFYMALEKIGLEYLDIIEQALKKKAAP